MYSTELKIKRLSLVAESRIIQAEERRIMLKAAKRAADGKKADRLARCVGSIRSHLVNVVRPEARAAHLAHAFLMERPYASVERSCKVPPNADAVLRIVSTFSYRLKAAVKPEIDRWLAGLPIKEEQPAEAAA